MRLDPQRLGREMARRGLDQSACAKAAGISHATMCAAARGKPVRSRTARAIAAALDRSPVVEALDVLLPPEGSISSER